MIFKKKKQSILTEERIQLNIEPVSKDEAIMTVGDALLKSGCVESPYITGMLEREAIATTYIGSSVAIPHGTNDSKQFVNTTGIAIHQYPKGVDFGNGNIAHLVIGIAAIGDEHMTILMQIADAVSDPEVLASLIVEKDPKKLLSIFDKKGLGV